MHGWFAHGPKPWLRDFAAVATSGKRERVKANAVSAQSAFLLIAGITATRGGGSAEAAASRCRAAPGGAGGASSVR